MGRGGWRKKGVEGRNCVAQSLGAGEREEQ